MCVCWLNWSAFELNATRRPSGLSCWNSYWLSIIQNGLPKLARRPGSELLGKSLNFWAGGHCWAKPDKWGRMRRVEWIHGTKYNMLTSYTKPERLPSSPQNIENNEQAKTLPRKIFHPNELEAKYSILMT